MMSPLMCSLRCDSYRCNNNNNNNSSSNNNNNNSTASSGTYFAFGMDHCHSTGSTLVARSTPLLSTSPWTLGSWKGTSIAGIPTCGFSNLRLTIDLDDSHSSKFDFEARPWVGRKNATGLFRGHSKDRHLLFTRVEKPVEKESLFTLAS